MKTVLLAVALALLAVANAAAQAPGLVAAFNFDEGTGTATADTSGNGFNGTLVNGPAWVAGRNASALAFDGLNDQVTLPSSLDVASLPFTLEAWVNPSSYSDWRAIFSKRGSYSSFRMRFDVGLAAGSGRVYVTSAATMLWFGYSPALNTWTHLAVVADKGGTSLYANGVLQQTVGALTLGSDAIAPVSIGRTGDGGDPFAGLLDDVRLYNRALGPTEVQLDMTTPVPSRSNTTPPTPPTDLTAQVTGPSQITLNWTASTSGAGISRYEIERCSNICASYSLIGISTATNYIDAGLTSAQFRYRVRAVDTNNVNGAYSAFVSIWMDAIPPSAPSNLTASIIDPTHVSLHWSPSTDDIQIYTYQVERCQGTGCSSFAEIASVPALPPGGPNYVDTVQGAATSYSYRVRTRDYAGNLSGYSNVVTPAGTSTPSQGPDVAFGFNEGSGPTTADASGNGFNGTLAGDPKWGSGRYNKALTFDGVDDKVALPSSLDVAALPLTLEAWVKPANFSNWHVIFSKRSSYSLAGMRFDAGFSPISGRVYVTTFATTRTFFYAPPLNAWTHLALVADAAGTKLYVNGVLQETSGAITLGTGANAAVNIGRTGDNDDAFAGSIDDLRLYKRALTAAEILTDLNTPLP